MRVADCVLFHTCQLCRIVYIRFNAFIGKFLPVTFSATHRYVPSIRHGNLFPESLSHVVAKAMSCSYQYDSLFAHCLMLLISGAKVERMLFKEVAVKLKVLLLYGSITSFEVCKNVEILSGTFNAPSD